MPHQEQVYFSKQPPQTHKLKTVYLSVGFLKVFQGPDSGPLNQRNRVPTGP